jgi:ABC-2 type transport system ATP-binding protein
MVSWENVTKVFATDLLKSAVVALDDVSFSLREGSMTGYLGANGAGKTTSLKIALGFTAASKGKIRFSPVLGASPKEALARTGFLPERPYFYPHLTGGEFSDYMGALSGVPRTSLTKRRQHLAERLKIDHALNRPLRTYSKGMLQRMGFLVAVQHDPALVILDEPLSGLDPVGRKEFKDMMGEINRQGKTVFFSTHVVSDVEETCDEVVFLRQGKLAFSGGVADLMARHASRRFRVVLAASPDACWDTPTVSSLYHAGVWTLVVEDAYREGLVREAVGAGAGLLGVSPEGASLEEIFYGLQS